jgi:hypothetical protein
MLSRRASATSNKRSDTGKKNERRTVRFASHCLVGQGLTYLFFFAAAFFFAGFFAAFFFAAIIRHPLPARSGGTEKFVREILGSYGKSSLAVHVEYPLQIDASTTILRSGHNILGSP